MQAMKAWLGTLATRNIEMQVVSANDGDKAISSDGDSFDRWLRVMSVNDGCK